MEIKLLDCTLRDGGFVNNWEFGQSASVCIFERLVSAKLDVIEIGLLDERQPFDIDRTIQPSTECFDTIFCNCSKGDSLVFAMIDYGTCSIDNIAPCKDTIIDGIRIIFKKPNMRKAIEFAKQIISKGYLVSLNLVSITSYEDRDILDFSDAVNEIKPYGIAIVDTYGLMHREEMQHYFELLDHNLNREIVIGYHSHNNFQLAYSNTVEFLKLSKGRILVADGSAYGMGKSAGNAPLELLAMYLNENYHRDFNISQILEVVDNNIMKIYKERYWGYSLDFYLAASNDCHPSYINYLIDKKTLSVGAVNDILAQISPEEKKLSYDEEYIKSLYISYQENNIADEEAIGKLKEAFMNKNLLVLAPGNTLTTEAGVINDYIEKEKPVMVAVNFVPYDYHVDYVFISNAKRYNSIFNKLQSRKNFEVIATSNISSVNGGFDYRIDYSKLLAQDKIEDNSMIMFLKMLSRMGISDVTLAGFDGYHTKDSNYFVKDLDYRSNEAHLNAINKQIKSQLLKIQEEINVKFITPTCYVED